jgi:hypothetical protein
MNGFTEQGLSDDTFGQAKGGISSFDAFREFLLYYSSVQSCVKINCAVSVLHDFKDRISNLRHNS